MGLLIQGALLLAAPSADCLPGDLAIEGNLIKEIGPDLTEKYAHFQIIDGRDSLLVPGFINCHTHAAMTLLRGYADDLPLKTWLETKIWPREAHLKKDDIYWGSKLALLEMLKSGTTTFADMYFFMEETAEAVQEAGLRAVLARGLLGQAQALKESEAFVRAWQGQAEGRITCFLGPHAPYTCSPDYLEKTMSLADDLGVGLHLHLAETEDEVRQIQQKYGQRPVRLMASLGLFQKRHVLAAHCVHLAPCERDLLVKYKVGIAHNPASNLKLASGIAPLVELLAQGALVGLGTDGAASNNNLDLLAEMRLCALLHKVQDPTVIPAAQALKLATLGGAQALGLDKLGKLAPGYKADLILFDLKKPHWYPLHNPLANLVYAAQSADIKTVIIDGQIIMRDREVLTLDEERILYEVAKRSRALVEK